MKDSRSGMAIATKSQPDEGSYYRWAEPNSDIVVCLKTETVDRLQMDALRGIASSPLTGKEVGGILLGRTENNKSGATTFVDDFVPFPCSRRNGPFFDLTAAEAADFESVLARGRSGWEQSVVGYYRSHNRDGLFLSPGDLRLIQRHFPAPDNIFLIIKTLPNRACTAGFFFWKDGKVQSEFTDSEAPLIPISLPCPVENPAPPDAVARNSLLAAAIERARRRILRERLIRGIAITAVAAAVTVAVISYRALRPLHSRVAPEIPLVARSKIAPPPSTPAAASIPKPLAPSPDPPQRMPATAADDSAAEHPGEPAPSISSQIPETPSADPLPANEPVSAPTARAPAAATEPPPNAVSPNPPEAVLAPPPLPLPVLAATPVSAPAPVTPTTAAPPAGAESSAAPNAAPLVPTHTRIGPQVIHQASPAVPRGVGPKITSDVQLDVEVAIDAKGKVTRARVVSTRGAAAGLLAIEALKAAQLFRFRPAREDGRNIASDMVLTFRFDQIAK